MQPLQNPPLCSSTDTIISKEAAFFYCLRNELHLPRLPYPCLSLSLTSQSWQVESLPIYCISNWQERRFYWQGQFQRIAKKTVIVSIKNTVWKCHFCWYKTQFSTNTALTFYLHYRNSHKTDHSLQMLGKRLYYHCVSLLNTVIKLIN